MTLAEAVLGAAFVGLVAYALFGGADFGGGVWDLLAGGTERGRRTRDRVERSIGPVWEANHVWLIFVLVVLWTGFSGAFAAAVTTLYLPLTLAAFGIIARGAAFAYRKSVGTPGMRRFFGAAFALSSLLTPFFFGAVVGGVASGRVPPGIAGGDVVRGWVNPTSFLGGALAVLVCAYLAAVFLCGDARRDGEHDLAEAFRRRALVTAAVTGAVGLAGIAVLRADAPLLFDGLTGRGLPVVLLSVAAGLTALGLLLARRYAAARIASAVAVAAILVGWAVGQYPYVLLPELTVEEAATGRSTLLALLIALAVGALVLVPALVYLYVLFQRPAPTSGPEGRG
ncbi:cytochrome d ubiquinol oxidase subunit II [Saccharothrix australiensis]|uniref:Cytochrome bd-I ubiquinol oxidase subunit 2 apoprotein n=1 Tax=Saccharothrix australiensis TaxID=2072 RepID=A0A495W3R1_9PSEU|nr:cytochrome d ubiquinol oxidase subunit II [Saccharothrix australiensis]RKT55730.1 cytochrome bd-I ubiquinol oxidase subunit 2 apoprotein [Saccharothrix australiensis]